jgi:AraC-like DNA-binding protein
MNSSFYENHVYNDPDFPIIFHLDTLTCHNNDFAMHWHENIELLYFIEGEANVTSDTAQFLAKTGDIVVINSNNLHKIHSTTPKCSYYCLIVDKAFCDSFALFIGDITFSDLVKDTVMREYFDVIIQEFLSFKPHYKTSVKSAILSILVHLCRYYSVNKTTLSHTRGNKKLDVVKLLISHIRTHYKQEQSIDEICSHIGFSKYYCCHTFKEITGRTIVDYTNFLRCSHAQKLLSSGKYNVSESAELSGFNNLSYFSKIYRKHMGISPSVETVKSLEKVE